MARNGSRTRELITPTDLEWRMVEPVLDKLGTSKEVKKQLRAGTGDRGQDLSLGSGWVLYRALNSYDYSWLSGDKFVIHSSGRWPQLVATYFSDPNWAAEQHKKFGHCLDIHESDPEDGVEYGYFEQFFANGR